MPFALSATKYIVCGVNKNGANDVVYTDAEARVAIIVDGKMSIERYRVEKAHKCEMEAIAGNSHLNDVYGRTSTIWKRVERAYNP